MNLEDKLVNILIENNYHIAFAESCTGGLCASKIINVSNASKVINESFITYSNYAKIKYLNVNPNTIEKYGVVSEEVAKEMAIGVAKISNSEVGIGISGIAGPTGETKTKPIGMVCFGFYINGKIITKTMYFGNIGRNKVREESAIFALKTALFELGGSDE